MLVVVVLGMWMSCDAEVWIDTAIIGREYTWTVRNEGEPPIHRIEIPVYHAYNFHVPKGWSDEGTDGEKVFVATADQGNWHVRSGQTLVVKCGINRAGASQAERRATVYFADNAKPPTMIAVTVPAPEPTSSVWVTPVALVAFLLIVGLLRRRRSAATSE